MDWLVENWETVLSILAIILTAVYNTINLLRENKTRKKTADYISGTEINKRLNAIEKKFYDIELIELPDGAEICEQNGRKVIKVKHEKKDQA